MSPQISELISPERQLFRFLDETGDGSGNKDSSVDGSSTPVKFLCIPAADEVFVITRMVVHVEDGTGFQGGGYGGIATSPLTNGIELDVEDGAGNNILQLTDGLPVTTNGDWSRFCHDLEYRDFGVGSTNKFMSVRWTFEKTGHPIKLNGKFGHRIVMTINDDLTDLVDHTAQIQGYILKR